MEPRETKKRNSRPINGCPWKRDETHLSNPVQLIEPIRTHSCCAEHPQGTKSNTFVQSYAAPSNDMENKRPIQCTPRTDG